VAIIAVRDSSIDRIIRERQVDYFSEEYDPEVTECALELLEADNHDFLLVYHQEYDDTMHRSGPREEAAIEAFRNHTKSFVRLAESSNRFWNAYDRLIGFIPDHGAHVDAETGKGAHGSDVAEDMDVQHFYGVFRRGLA